MGKYFGTDGFRGKAGEGLTADHAYQIGRFLGWYFGRTHRAQIVVGKDTRRSSYMFEYSLRRRRPPAPCHHHSLCLLRGPYRRL